MKILIKNIKELIQVEDTIRLKVCGGDMSKIKTIKDAWLAIENDLIVDFGEMKEFPGISDWSNLVVIDASGKMVFPSWCDSHTHLVFAGSREGEFVDRIKGLTYEEISARGGGILNSSIILQATSEEDLLNSALIRMEEIKKSGTGAVEIKSGYGLTLESELKMLRVIKKLKKNSDLTVKATFLGAHAFPLNYKNDRKKYLDLVINEMIPQLAADNLADYCDVFCEKNYFSKEETVKILQAASIFGMRGKVHAEQLSKSGGIEAGVECNAISVDHLEFADENDLELLKNSETMPTILPGAQFFLGLQNPPARKFIDSGLPLAISSDYNPGSCPTGNMNFMVSLACIKNKLTPEEAINAATINSSYAMDLSRTHGSICRGKKANIFITKEIPSYSFLPYSFSNNPIETVILNGKIQ